MSTQTFEFVAPGKIAQLFPIIIGALLPLVILGAMAFAAKSRLEWLHIAPVVLILPFAGSLLAWSMHKQTLGVTEKALIIPRLVWRRQIMISELDLDQANVINLHDHRELQPVFKIAGTALPGYRVGWFRLRDRRRAYVRLTDWQRVLVLPKQDGGLLLLSLQRPEALLNALRKNNP